MVYLLDNLESAGLVTRRPDPADRRVRQVLITDKGTMTLGEARELLGVAEATLPGSGQRQKIVDNKAK